MVLPHSIHTDSYNAKINVTPSQCRYVVLLDDTEKWQVFNDLKKCLKLNKKPNCWFIKVLGEHRVRVEYATAGTRSDARHLGPQLKVTSYGMLRQHFKKTYDPNVVQLVAPTFIVKKIWDNSPCPYRTLHPETLRNRLCP